MFKPGTKLQNWCPHCEKVVSLTMGYGDFEAADGVKVRRVLRGTCDECGTVIATAPEAAPAIRQALDKHPHRRAKTTVRAPRALLEAVNAALRGIEAEPTDYDLVIRGFLLYLLDTKAHHKRAVSLLKNFDDPVLSAPPDAALTIRLSPHAWTIIDELESEADIWNTSELIRRILAIFAHTWAGPRSRPQAVTIVSEVRKLAMVS